MLTRLMLVLSLVSGLLLTVACGSGPSLKGTVFTPPESAPDFALVDQRGQPVQLSDLHGNAIALTFIYTNCTDVCPLIAEKLRRAYDALPPATQAHVQMLAVTVDPARDNQAALQAFTAKHQLDSNPHWHAMTGNQLTLEQTWKAYFIYPGDIMGGSVATPGAAAEGGSHTDAIYFIDPNGKRRALLRADADPADITANLKALAAS